MPRLPTLLVLLVLAVPAGAAQAVEPDTLSRVPVRLSVAPIVGAFYSPTHGVGVGVELGIHNVGWTGSVIELSAEPMTRFGRYGARFFTGDPFEAPVYAGTGVTYTVTNSYNLFGFGPLTRREVHVRTSMVRLEAELRAGAYPLGSRLLLLQPVARLYYDRVRDFEMTGGGGLEAMELRSRENLLRALDNPSVGISYGLEVVLDGLDLPHHPSRGVLLQSAVRRYDGLDDDPFRYWRGSLSTYGFFPIERAGVVLKGRVVTTLTRNAGERPIPFYALPRLDSDLLGGFTRDRFAGNDVLAVSVGGRARLLEVFGLVALDASLTAHAANAYDDLFRQLLPGLTFDRDPVGRNERAPLRPSLGVGGYLVHLGRGKPVISGQIGVSPEGFELATLRFVYDFRHRRPLLR